MSLYVHMLRMRLARYVARMEERRGVYRVLVGKPEGRRSLGRHRRRWEDNIEMDINLIVAPCIFCRITSTYEPTNAHIISYKTLYNTPTCFDLDRSSSGSFVPC